MNTTRRLSRAARNDKRQDLSANACFHLAPLCPPTACASPSGALSISFLGSLCSSRSPDASPLSRPGVESPYLADAAV